MFILSLYYKTVQGITQASMAQLVERSAVNRQVLGSIPSGGVFFFTHVVQSVYFCVCKPDRQNNSWLV